MTTYLTTKKEDTCYGCSACKHICPHSAINMEPNSEGFMYPKLDADKCVQCGLCVNVCPYDTPTKTTSTTSKTYAIQNKDNQSLMNSSSGGIFIAVAKWVLEQGGSVCGCVFDENFKATHVLTNEWDTVLAMQGSKYVQSDIGDMYPLIRSKLKSGQKVLFTGTPCQVAGLQKFLIKEYDNLITMDLICHGVPSPMLLESYLKEMASHRNGKILDFRFRHKKRNGWVSQGSITIQANNGKQTTKTTSPYQDSYYYYYYLANNVSRECCYSCQYSSTTRYGDLTIGDYWNIADVNVNFNTNQGVSVVLVNTNKGQDVINAIKDFLNLAETPLETAVQGNGNLHTPCERPESRDIIYKKIINQGYKKTAEQECHFSYILPTIKRMMPKWVKRIIKKVI